MPGLLLMYTGRKNQKHTFSSWLFGTVILGLVPLVLRLFILFLSEEDITVSSVYSELFFEAIVLFVYAVQNLSQKGILFGCAILMIIVSSGLYMYFCISTQGLLNMSSDPLKSVVMNWITGLSLAVGVILDLVSIFNGGAD